MSHPQIEYDEIIERYVRNRLAPEQRQAFEEHYFACDECFEKLRATERFVAGVQDLARRGGLDNAAESAGSRKVAEWPLWALAGTSLAAVGLAALAGWAFLHRIPMLQQELSVAIAKNQAQQTASAQLQPAGKSAAGPEANVPLAMLQALRGEETTTAVLAPGARQLILWVEIGPMRYRSFRLEVYSSEGKRIMMVDGLTPGPYGALAASLPAEALQPGTFRITLIGQTPSPTSLVSEYRLRIRKP